MSTGLAAVISELSSWVRGGALEAPNITAVAPRNALGLELYRRGYRHNVTEGISTEFPVTSRVVEARIGAAAWAALLREFGRDRSFGCVRFGTASFVELLGSSAASARGVPSWAWELADLELVETMVAFAAETSAELRLYEHRVLDVRASATPEKLEPRCVKNVVAIWRDRAHVRWTKQLCATELAVLQLSTEPMRAETMLAETATARLGGVVSLDDVEATIAEMRASDLLGR